MASVDPGSPTLSHATWDPVEESEEPFSKTAQVAFGIFCLIAAGAMFYGMNQAIHVWKETPGNLFSRDHLVYSTLALTGAVGGTFCTVMALNSIQRAFPEKLKLLSI